MSSCSGGNSSACCALILKQYPDLNQAIQQCQPDMSSEMVNSLMWLLYLSLNPIYQKVKCGKIFCCDGLVAGVFCAFQTFLTVGGGDIDSLVTTINAVLSQAGISLSCDPSGLPDPSSIVFGYTGAQQSLQIPARVFQIQIEAFGAQAGNPSDFQGTPGSGGSAVYILSVTPGDTIYIYVGGQGGDPVLDGISGGYFGGVGGFNGGATGGSGGTGGGGGGGGASDVRVGGFALANRVVIAGGGGGAAPFSINGGMGGGTTGGIGGGTLAGNRGQGGTQSAGGAGATSNQVGSAGTLGNGGNAGPGDVNNGDMFGGGGGGGGYYGGGGGRTSQTIMPQAGGGGGGSGFTPDGTGLANGTFLGWLGNGQVTITYLCF